MTTTPLPTYTPKDFTTDQDVRWCPGCGDYAVLTAVRKALPNLDTRKEDYVFVSGIGCAARFPYYMNTYGLHSIHGRAPAFATGIKLANPKLDVWLVSGDGDLLSIGGNHTMHAIRRNLDINILLLNNRIYGLTKGQYSPTSELGKKTKSTPVGSADYPLNPLSLAIGCGCTFVARTIDVDVKHEEEMMVQAASHRGLAFIEIYQDCNIFNHQAWFYASQKDSRPETTVMCRHGEPLIFGANNDKGIRLRDGKLEAVRIAPSAPESGSSSLRSSDPASLLVHDETNRGLAFLLAQMQQPELPEPIGVLYRSEDSEPYEDIVRRQVAEAQTRNGAGDLRSLLHQGDTWTVK